MNVAVSHPTPTGRTWRLGTRGQRPLTVNEVARLHRQQWAVRTRQTRVEFWGLAKQARIPKLGCIAVTVIPTHRDDRSPQDVAACAPAAKAAIDGLVDAGVVPDDGPEHLLSVTFEPPLVCGRDGLTLLIEEMVP